MDEVILIHVSLIKKGSNEPITGDEYRVEFYDQDFIKDDFLGESDLDANGHALVPITRKNFVSLDSPLEKYPDIYFKVFKNGKKVYKSAVFQNLHLQEAMDYPTTGGLHFNLGTFVV